MAAPARRPPRDADTSIRGTRISDSPPQAPHRTAGHRQRPSLRLLFILPGGAALLLGLAAAYELLGFTSPIALDRLAALHAPLLVFGFIGTLIALERAVAIRRVWGFLAPVALGLGALSLLTPLPLAVGQASIAVGFAVQVLVYVVIWRRQPAAATAIQILGAVAALATALLWLAQLPIPDLVPGMAVYLILTIAGERLELGRISPTVTPRVETVGVVLAILLTASVLTAPLAPEAGYPLLGVSLLALVAWLLRFDVATRLIRATGQTRYMAWCLLAGYVWLIVAGLGWAILGEPTGWAYDAVLHAVFLGFVMSMIMAHAPLILPAVLRILLPYRPFLYAPVVLLHVTLAVRIIGDARESVPLVQWGGIGNILALLLFVACAITTASLGPVKKADVRVAAAGTATEPTSAPASASDSGFTDPARASDTNGPQP